MAWLKLKYLKLTLTMKYGSAHIKKRSSSRKWNKRPSMSSPDKSHIIFLKYLIVFMTVVRFIRSYRKWRAINKKVLVISGNLQMHGLIVMHLFEAYALKVQWLHNNYWQAYKIIIYHWIKDECILLSSNPQHKITQEMIRYWGNFKGR